MLSLSDIFSHHTHILEGFRDDADAHQSAFLSDSASSTCEFFTETYGTFTIKESRFLAEQHRLRQPAGLRKVFIIFADTIMPPAQHALLKVLEEPTEGTHFLIITPQSGDLLPTLLSRAKVHRRDTSEVYVFQNDHAQSFIRASIPERLRIVKALIEESEDENDSSRLVSSARMFVRDVGVALRQKSTYAKGSDMDALTACLSAEERLGRNGSSIKMLLESIALALR